MHFCVRLLCWVFIACVPSLSPHAAGHEERCDAARIRALADSLYQAGRYDDARMAYERHIDLLSTTHGGAHPDIIDSEVWVSATHWKMGRHAEGERMAREALGDARRLHGGEHVQVAECLNMLGLCCMAQGKFDEAEEAYRAALRIFKEQLGEENEKVSMCLNNLGALAGETDDWVRAEAYYRASLDMNRKLLGDDNLRVARGMHNLGFVLKSRDILGAEPLLTKALAIRRRHLGNEHPDVATSLQILAGLRGRQGDLDTGIALAEEAVAIRRRVLGDRHPYVAWGLITLGTFCVDRGDLECADTCYSEAIDILEESGPVMDRMRALGYQAGLLLRRGEIDEGERLLLEAQQIHVDHLGFAGPRYAMFLGRIQAYRGNYAAAESLLVLSASVFETERLRFADVLHRTATASMNPYHELAAARLRLGRPDGAWQAMQRMRGRVLIDQLSAAAGEEREGRVYDLKEVQASLRPNEAILGWLDVVGFPSPAAWAYVIRSVGPVRWAPVAGCGNSTPLRVRYGDWRAVSDRPALFRESLRFAAAWPTRVTAVERLNLAARSLWDERFAPVREHLLGVTELIVIPSEVMLGVPIEALVDDEGVTIGSRYAVSYASSATAYCWLHGRPHRQAHRIDRALLVGDPLMDEGGVLAGGTSVDGHEIAMAVESRVLDTTVLRSTLAGNPDAMAALPRLPQARNEVVGIGSLIPDPTTLVGAEASEDALQELATSGELRDFDVLHFATHALIDPISPQASALVLSQVDLSDPLEAPSSDPVTDGLLTVEEIIAQWKLDADVVTLSGCQTALGTTARGEGYLGFANAFFYAGARSVIVSLWDVDDTATSMLMRRFYENLTGNYEDSRDGQVGAPMSKSHALQEAKLWLRGVEMSGTRPFVHPAYWAAFILIGNRS
jgi:CHAT domain-containing protein/tetratricopeptide (TPR) repeat protein